MNASHLNSIEDKLNYWLQHMPDHTLFRQPVNGEYQTYTWRDVSEQAHRLLGFFRTQGLVKGDRIAILSKNCAHWMIADIAMMLGGYVSIPIYPTANSETIDFVLKHSESKLLLVGKLDNWQSQQSGIPESVKKVALPYPTMESDFQWEEIIANTEPDMRAEDVNGDELMTILYTSGSTGDPKGAMHTYNSFFLAGNNIGNRFAATPQDRILSYLPLSHCTERAFVESVILSFGCQVYYVESLDTFARDLATCRPTIFGSVPRLWIQFQKGILTKLPSKKLNRLLRIPIIRSMVRNKIKKQMGLDQAKVFLSGSAPLSTKVLEWYRNLGIEIAEGWGMTESFACGTQIIPGSDVKFGTVSQAVENTELKIADDDEILLRSQSNMLGYYKDDDKTKETLTEDGFIRTGDLGKLEDGYLSIVGRKKDIFKTDKGKYVAPIPIESEFADNEFIELMCLMGTQLTQPILVANLSQHGNELAKADMEMQLKETLAKVNQKLEAHEKVGGVIVAQTAWTTESGELTPTLKVKRHVIESRFLEKAQQVAKGAIEWH